MGASTEYASFASTNCTGLTDQACYKTFDDNATVAQKAAMTAAFQQFAYAAQTVLDTIDPYTNADYLLEAPTQMPIYMGQVQGDKTVPNTVADAPFAGTTPLATKLGLTVVDASNTTPNGTNDFVKFSDVASHSTFVSPQTANDTDQYDGMQDQATDFLEDNKLDNVDNTNLILE